MMHAPCTPLTFRMAMQLAAPHTWVASLSPALFGVIMNVLEKRHLTMVQAAALVGASVCMQSSVNTLNDYTDFIKGTDSRDDYVEKTDSVLVYNAVHPHAVLKLGILYFIFGALLGIFGCWHAGWVPLCIGLIGGVTVALYSAGPLPISYVPIGELVSGFIMGGLIPLGITASADGLWHWGILPYSLPLIVGIALIMMSNNGSDIEKDRRAGRKTLPAYIGRKNTLLVYRVLLLLWIMLLCVLPIVKLGHIGIFSPIVLAVISPWVFIPLMQAAFLPEKRIQQMKAIVLANICGNGLYIAVFALKAAVDACYG